MSLKITVSAHTARLMCYYLRRVVPRGAEEAAQLSSIIDELERIANGVIQR